MTRRWALAACALATTVALVACESDDSKLSGPQGQSAFTRYVAMGTSISMGVQGSGVYYGSQVNAWPAQLARLAQVNFTQPLIRGPGCFPPIVPPLQFSINLRGASAATTDTTCAALFTGTILPANDVAIDGATAYTALYLTPDSTAVGTSQKRRKQYPLVLPRTMTQVTAMLSEKPTFVSVELGANEVLPVLSGLVVPATSYTQPTPYTLVPVEVFGPTYDSIIQNVKATGAKAILVGVPDVGALTSVRKGSDIFKTVADSLAFNGFYVTLSSNCKAGGAGADNAIFVAQKVPTIIAAGRTAASTGAAKPVFSCADVAGTQDNILTPADLAAITDAVGKLNAHIQAQATLNGYAYLDLDALLKSIAIPNNPPYDVVKQMSCVRPYGQFVSIDGVHPNNAGHLAIADAAAGAINDKYGFTLLRVPPTILTAAQLCP